MEEIVLGLVKPEQVVAVSNYSRKSKFPEIAEKAKKVKGEEIPGLKYDEIFRMVDCSSLSI